MVAASNSARSGQPAVLVVTGAYRPEFSSGGLQSEVVIGVLTGHARFRVLTTSTDRFLVARETLGGVEVSRIAIDVRSWVSRLGAAIRLVVELFRLVPGVDVIHIQGFSSKNVLVSLVAALYRRPVIIHLQTSRHDEPPAIVAQGSFAWRAFRSASAYISVSRNLTEAYLDAGLPADRIREVPNGVDTRRFHPATPDQQRSLRERLGLPANLPIVLFVGVISPDKQPHILLEAWTMLQESPATRCAVVFVGASDASLFELEGRLIEALRSEAAKLGASDRVFFAPPTSRIEDYYRASDLLVMPSLREGMPNVLLEAMSCGLAVVASRLPGSTTTVIDDGRNGMLVAVGDVAGFSSAMARVLQDRVFRESLGTAARETIEARFKIEQVAEAWLALYRDLHAASS